MEKDKAFILWFDQLSIDDVPLVGGKNASLGEMYRELTPQGVKVPNGFAVTAYAYHYLLNKAGIRDEIRRVLEGLNTHDTRDLEKRGAQVRHIILQAEFPQELKDAIIEGYRHMRIQYGDRCDVAVRSSATAEDLPDASFAGQQETYLNIVGDNALLEACKKCMASLFTNRAISYRQDKGFDHFSIGLSIGVQKMVRSDKATSGVMFSIDTESGFRNAALITASYGLGENIVQGAVNPDEFYVFKTTLREGKKPLLQKKLGAKSIRMIYATDGTRSTKNIPVSKEEQERFCITDDEVLQLARWAIQIEDHYTKKRGKDMPMDMEWAKDGFSGELFIVQARPETVQSNKDMTKLKNYVLKGNGKILAQGNSVGSRIGTGKAHVIKDVNGIHDFRKGDVLVTEMTDPDWEPIMKIASAIVTNRGGRTCFGGETNILTNRGFMTMEEVYGTTEPLLTLSINRETMKTEWKPIVAVMRKESSTIPISVSQTGRITENTLNITPDHNMINIRGGELVKTEIQTMINEQEMVCLAQRIPSLEEATARDKQLAYLLGGIMTDGHIYRSRTHGEIQFIQKPTQEKEAFISHMQSCMTSVYHKSFVAHEKNLSSGMIRGKEVRGQANAYRLYSKQIAYEMHDEQQNIVTTLLNSSNIIAKEFLAGVIDGDGNYYNNRINIYVSSEQLLQAIVVACLKLEVVPQVTKNRTIHHVQIVEHIDELLHHTKRVKGEPRERTIKTRFFSAKQLFGEEAKGQLKLRRDKNLYVSEEDIQAFDRFSSLVKSDLRMQRVCQTGQQEQRTVYNITVADNHTYVVFTKKYTPLAVHNCHAAIISRELGIPCVVGCLTATVSVTTGQDITVDCSQGEKGLVFEGKIPFDIEEHDLGLLPKTKTKIMMNLANPEQAFEQSFIPNSGVGLARMEFIIMNRIQAHPLALLHPDRLDDAEQRDIHGLIKGYENGEHFFVENLAQGIGMIAAAFHPRPVILRFSDFKTNEYANLLGGKHFEPVEENPMIGWRGSSRYYHEKYKEGFALECQAIKKVREDFGLTNLKTMVPFCRTLDEARKVISVMAENGLRQHENGLQIIGMCEVPSNVILAEEFLDIFDGYSIGSNDLTQLTLGVDRDSAIISPLYDERNEAVKRLIAQVIKIANIKGKYIGICGQSVSDFVEMAEFVVEQGIQTLSLNPDTILSTTLKIAQVEKDMGIYVDQN